MMLYVDVRPSVLTDERLARLRGALERHPGHDQVLVVVRRERVRLPLTVDASSRALCRDAAEAFDGVAVMVQAYDERELW